MSDTWKVYLSGEIHSEWREQISSGVTKAGLPVTITGPVTDHDSSDMCGVRILGDEEKKYWEDRKGAGLNAIRTRTLIQSADVVVVRFGDQYRQWNAAFDAGLASAFGKPLVTFYDEPGLQHALKEIDCAALATCSTPDQVVAILRYVIRGELS